MSADTLPMPTIPLPMPNLNLREMVGPTAPEDFDNPHGTPIYAHFDLPLEVYESVFDFGCGCGRLARQLIQQQPPPARYIGIDPNRSMIDWCNLNLVPFGDHFEFYHHDVYSPMYSPDNSLCLAQPFPAQPESCTLFIAHSVFTHLTRPQTEYYLSELARILRPGGVAFTSWFFFDRASFPFLREGPHCLYTSESDFAQAVMYDRQWFLAMIRSLGLGVQRTIPPRVPGHQWMVFLEKRRPDMVDAFPLGADASEYLCGATYKPMAGLTEASQPEVSVATEKYQPAMPSLYGALAELAWMKSSWAWKIGRTLTAPIRLAKNLRK